MQQGQSGEQQRQAAEQPQHRPLRSQCRTQQGAYQQRQRPPSRQSQGAKFTPETTRVVQQRLPVAPQQQAQQADQLQGRRGQADQRLGRQRGLEQFALFHRQLLVVRPDHLRPEFLCLHRYRFDGFTQRRNRTQYPTVHQAQTDAAQEHSRPGGPATQDQRQSQGTHGHEQQPRITQVTPDQRRQQCPGQDAERVMQTAPQHHQTGGRRTQPEQQRQDRSSNHHQGGLHATAHDELGQGAHGLYPLPLTDRQSQRPWLSV